MRRSDTIKSRLLENPHDTQIGESLHDEITLWLYSRIVKSRSLGKLITGTAYQKVDSFERLMEVPLWSRNRFPNIVGFADLAVMAITTKEEKDEDDRSHKTERKELGFVEIKTKINIGQTIRQINLYKTCIFRANNYEVINAQKWTVCAPPLSDALIQVLNEQDINFVPYRPDHG